MSNLDDEIKKLVNSQQFKTQCDNKVKTNKNIEVNKNIKSTVSDYAKKIKDILHEEISGLVSETTSEAFLDHISTNVYFENGKGWVVDISFDTDSVTRDSLSNNFDSVYLPALINNEWDSSALGRVWGYDRHGSYVIASDKYMNGSFKGFIETAIQRFKSEVGNEHGIIVEVNGIYDNGTL